jgi:hypothetical protein
VLKMPITTKPSLHGANLVDFQYQAPAKNAQEPPTSLPIGEQRMSRTPSDFV